MGSDRYLGGRRRIWAMLLLLALGLAFHVWLARDDYEPQPLADALLFLLGWSAFFFPMLFQELRPDRLANDTRWVLSGALFFLILPYLLGGDPRFPWWLRAGYVVVTLAALAPPAFSTRRDSKTILFGAYAALVIFMLAVPFTLPTRFYRDGLALREGMTLAQVQERMAPWVEDTPWPWTGPWPIPPGIDRGDPAYYGARDAKQRPVKDPWSLKDGTLWIPGHIAYHNNPELAAGSSRDIVMVTLKDGLVENVELDYD